MRGVEPEPIEIELNPLVFLLLNFDGQMKRGLEDLIGATLGSWSCPAKRGASISKAFRNKELGLEGTLVMLCVGSRLLRRRA